MWSISFNLINEIKQTMGVDPQKAMETSFPLLSSFRSRPLEI